MDTTLYTPAIVARFRSLIYNDTRVLNTNTYKIYRMGGCSTILRLDVLDNEWKHCTSADMFGAVTSDCICEYINTTNNKEQLITYINNAIDNILTGTSLDIIISLPTKVHSINLILAYYKQHISNCYE
jgi:hypothetical protein